MNKLILITAIFSFILILILIFYLYMIKSDHLNYSLGDVIEGRFNNIFSKNLYSIYFKDTIADQYYKQTTIKPDYKILKNIVDKESKKLKELPDKDSLVIHLRIGDVIDLEYTGSIDQLLNSKYDINKEKDGEGYLKSYDYFNQKLQNFDKLNSSKKIIIVTKYNRINNDHSRSKEYLNKIVKFTEGKGYDVRLKLNNLSADEDFTYMCNSKYYLQTGGGFTRSISKIVDLKGGIVL